MLFRSSDPLEIRPVIAVRLAAARTLDVHDLDDAVLHLFEADVPARLEHHREPVIQQPLHERIDVLLQQRLATGDLDHLAVERLHAGHDVVDRHLVSFGEGVRRIAPGTAEVAGRQAYEHAPPARMSRLPLDRMEDLVNREHSPDSRGFRRFGGLQRQHQGLKAKGDKGKGRKQRFKAEGSRRKVQGGRSKDQGAARDERLLAAPKDSRIRHGQGDLFLETHVNDLPQRQKFSGPTGNRRRRA